jgi:hypothetical protein
MSFSDDNMLGLEPNGPPVRFLWKRRFGKSGVLLPSMVKMASYKSSISS